MFLKMHRLLSSLLFILFSVSVVKADAFLYRTAIAPALSEASPIVYSEGAALLTLRGMLGIKSRYWPRKVDPCQSWVGIHCENGHVIAITLSGLKRTPLGALHPVFSVDPLQNLSSLAAFNSSGFALSGVIPDRFGALSKLQLLDLSSCFINSSLPTSLGDLVNLQTLAIAKNNLSGRIPSSLGNLTSLTFLDLSENFLTGSIPESLINLKNLITLNLKSNQLRGQIPPGIAGFLQLQVLQLGDNALQGSMPAEFGNLTSLKSLDLSFNNLSGILPDEFGQWTHAQEVLLSNNFFYGTIPSSILSLSKTSRLDLSKNYFEGTPPAVLLSWALLNDNCLTTTSNQHSLNICQSFYLSKGILFQGKIVVPPPELPLAVDDNVLSKSNHLAPILGGVFGGVGFVILIVILVVFCIIRRQKNGGIEQTNDFLAGPKGVSRPFSGNISINLLCLGDNFSYAQLQQATGDFNDASFLKAGRSGDFYHGFLEGHMPIVVKRIDLSRFKKDSYLSELDLFAKASHTRLVPLLGHCLEREEEKFLVYKYMPGRDLGHVLEKKRRVSSSVDGLQSLDWITRLKVAIGAAEGLAHLHHECTPSIVHRDIQLSSIFLDEKYEVRLGSLSKACVAVGEAHHGVITRLLRRSQTSEQGEAGASAPTCAHDVFCFGKVLLELVTGKIGISGSTDPSTDAWLEWALSFINVNDKELVSKIMDPGLIVDEDLLDEVWAMSIVAKSCLNPKPSKRPLMRYILKALENPLKVVREEPSAGSGRVRTSSHGSWNGAFFGSWHHSSSETAIMPGSLREEYVQKNKQSLTGVSQGNGVPVETAFSQRRPGSSEIFPEPPEDSIIQAPTNRDSDRRSA